MKTRFLFLIGLWAASAFAVSQQMPQNVRFEVCTLRVAANGTAYSKKLSFAGQAWKVGKIAIIDSTKSTDSARKTIDIGAGATGGFRLYQQNCFPVGNQLGYKAADTLCDVCGDTAKVAFINQPVLSGDSLICAAIDTTKMIWTKLGKDSLFVSKGYFVMVPDPAPMTRFKALANSGFGASVKHILVLLWSFDGYPIFQEK